MFLAKSRTFDIRNGLKQHPTYFGVAMIALLWIGTWSLIETERAASHQAVRQNTANLSRVFEENVIRSVSEIDKTLRFLRQTYQRDPKHATWSGLVNQAYAASEITVQLGVIDAKGRLAASSRGPQPPRPIDLSDREHFKVHAAAKVDRLFISRPVLGRVSKTWSVQLARRLEAPDGGFAGVIVASLDPAHFSDFYRSIALGAGSSITVVGDDGFVRASGGAMPYQLGSALPTGPLRAALAHHQTGTVMAGGGGAGDDRIVSFRRVRGFPLSVIVAASATQPTSSWQRNRPIYIVTAGTLTLVILIASLLSMRRSLRLAETRRQLMAKSEQLEVTLENISQGVLMVDEHGRVGFFSRRCAELLDLPPDLGSDAISYAELVGQLERNGEFQPLAGHALLDLIRDTEGGPQHANYERVRPDGTILEVRSTALPGGGFVRTVSDITGRRKAEAQILQLARHDGLTELANRAVFRQRLEDATAGLANGHAFAVHMLDLDRFKQVNDTYGHLIGDRLLTEVAARLRRIVRGIDVVARIGGDEFAVIQLETTEAGQAVALAERLCRALGEPYRIDGQPLTIGCSAGIALAPEHASSAADIVQAADLALYAAKSSRLGSFALYQPQMSTEHWARRALETDLRAALAEDQFELHYQPIKSLESGEVSAYEALIRWRHPRRGLVPPLEFIPLAEENGLIVQIGAWVLRTACRDIASRSGKARVAINLSPVQFRDPDMVATIVAALEESGLPASRLEIEITETALLQDDVLTQRHLGDLRALGIHITMDDFGTGYSSLAYLLSYPIQSIKIDRSFVQGLGQHDNCSAIVKTIMTLASSMGLSTTAEGVETIEQLELLRKLGCREAQGFYFSRPMPADDILPPTMLRWDVKAAAGHLRLAAG